MRTPAFEAKPKVSPLYDPKVRSLVFQAVLCLVIAFLLYQAYANAVENLRRAKIASGLGFWDNIAGFPISQSLIYYSEASSSYGRAFWVGLLNTLLVASIGIVLATILGFIVGIARLSRNFLVAKIAYWYVEIVRNLPLLLQLLFWYNAVIKALPEVRDSISFPGGIYLNNRGFIFPTPNFGEAFWLVTVTFWAGVLGALFYRAYARKKQEATGIQSPVGLTAFGLIVGLPLAVFLLAGMPLSFQFPQAGRFNITGGVSLLPEFLALLFGLVIYTAAFIAEAVRAGILAVSKGQTEAAYALGLTPKNTLNLVVIPQAMRVIIPPLTSHYLNLTKNSSLAVFVGYPDLVNIFTGTVLNQTGQAIEVVAITMLVYLTISLTTSLIMNWYNARKALVER
ncbi:MAG: amino acid ABC transporter permease [Methylocystis sp.]|nr:amino acid ABC transporter permease [Methylocystis sp.]MCA3584500.1 amino acid ABC transporter permease [Methylocystis sp.]MCA3589291.1 amino acid ABC transporter permease [Methylocystis sp.]MCA3591401.1 amino acid ABC transporter permease [Methylocystis sp.]